jgi:NAD(P)-dependent dehydrogenase (short-subunit alcohol dehydrogenase family)
MTPASPSPVLITGCSSGIGKATASYLAGTGHTVYATARRPETLADLERAGCRVLALDVTDEDSMTAAVKAVEQAHGKVGALVNNAGYGEYGPIEEVALDRVRRQFETNVFGLVRLCQLVLPGMRAAGGGRIVNVSSVAGRLTLPAAGYYHASKYAVEAISDALRFEVRPFGVHVILIEPGLIRTGFGDTAAQRLSQNDQAGSAYAQLTQKMHQRITSGYTSRLISTGPEAVAAVIERALTSSRPRARYMVTPAARAALILRKVLPDRAFDALLRTQFPVR